MQLFDPNNPNEKKKMIAAAVLGVAAIAVLGYVFFGGSSKKPTTNNTIAKAQPTPAKIAKDNPDTVADDPSIYQRVVYNPAVAAGSEADRNIFAYYEPTPKPTPPPYIPTPTPAPPPPLTITSLTPSNVYARTPADFSLQVMGDKFTPAFHVTIDGRDLPTRFVNAQQLLTTVPATLIANPGVRQVMVRSNDVQALLEYIEPECHAAAHAELQLHRHHRQAAFQRHGSAARQGQQRTRERATRRPAGWTLSS